MSDKSNFGSMCESRELAASLDSMLLHHFLLSVDGLSFKLSALFFV